MKPLLELNFILLLKFEILKITYLKAVILKK